MGSPGLLLCFCSAALPARVPGGEGGREDAPLPSVCSELIHGHSLLQGSLGNRVLGQEAVSPARQFVTCGTMGRREGVLATGM